MTGVFLSVGVSAFQAMELVPGVFVHSGLRRPQTVCSGQHQPAADSRRWTERQRVHSAEVDAQLTGEEKQPFASHQFFKKTCTYFISTSLPSALLACDLSIFLCT